MPAEYRKQLIRMIEQHAHSEIIEHYRKERGLQGHQEESFALMAKFRISRTCPAFCSAAEMLGKPREEMINDLITGKSKYFAFNYPGNVG